MSFAEHRSTLVDSVFAVFGEDARWPGVSEAVRVRRSSSEDEEMVSRLSVIMAAEVLRVRKSEVPSPANGDLVELLDAAGVPTGETLKVTGEPRTTRNGVWEMAFVAVEG
jgi:hypothetical protein